MVCYVVPTLATVLLYALRRVTRSKNVYVQWLNIMLLGGTIFGIVDHLWKGELFLISSEPWKDIMLGVIITFATFIVWSIIAIVAKSEETSEQST